MTDARASDMLVAIWSFCEPEDREAFVSYLAISGYLDNFPSADSANMEPDDVDRSAERASSAVEVGAPVSPEGAEGSGHQRMPMPSLAAREADESAVLNSRVESRERQKALEVSKPEATPKDRSLPSVGPSGTAAQEFPLQTSPETGSAGDPSPTSGQMDLVEAGTGQNCAVLPQEPCTAQITPSAANPAEAVAAPQPPAQAVTAKVSSSEAPPPGVTEKAEAPSSSPEASAAHSPDPRSGGGATAVPANQAPQLPAQNGDVSHVDGQDGAKPRTWNGHAGQEDASAAQDRNEPVSASGATVTSPKPGCLSPDHCRIKFQTSALCWKCRDAQTKARAA